MERNVIFLRSKFSPNIEYSGNGCCHVLDTGKPYDLGLYNDSYGYHRALLTVVLVLLGELGLLVMFISTATLSSIPTENEIIIKIKILQKNTV